MLLNVLVYDRMAFIAQNFNSADLKTYLTKYRSGASGYTIPVVTADGAINIGALPVSLEYLTKQNASLTLADLGC